MEEESLSTTILQNVLQIGRLDYKSTMEGLLSITGSTEGQFFDTDSINFICRYSTEDRYSVGQRYSFDELPLDNFPIMHKSNVIALICMNAQGAIDDMNDTDRQRIFDSISVGMVMGRLKEENYGFATSLCHVLGRMVQQILETVSTLPRNNTSLQWMDRNLGEILAIIYDALDYLEIDGGRIVMTANLVDVTEFIREILTILQQDGSYITSDIEDSVPKVILFDRKRVQQMLISVTRKLSDLKGIRLNLKLENFSRIEDPNADLFLYFHLFSDTSRQNQEIQRRFRIEQVSVDSLGIHVVKKLCDMMMGTFTVSDIGITIRIKVGLPPQEKEMESFKGRSVLIAFEDVKEAQRLATVFSALGMQVTYLKDRATSLRTNQLEGQAIVAIDSSFTDVGRTAKRRGIPVVGVGKGVEETLLDAHFPTLPVSWKDVVQKCEHLMERKASRWL